MEPGTTISLKIDQTLTQDATGTMAMLAFEALGLDRVRTEVSAQYVDHNLLQADFRNADDHLFLESACKKFGLAFSPPGNGVSHPVHMQNWGAPGKTLLGSDSHTTAAGSMAMLAFGAGGLDVALAMAGVPYSVTMPRVRGVRLTGSLPDWVSAKDVILELLRRHDVDGGNGQVFEYFGPGLDALSAMDRHVIANMGTELGAVTSIFPSDDKLKEFLIENGRGGDYQPLAADPKAEYDITEEIDLSKLVPLIALPSSPGNVVPVSEVAGKPVYQCVVGSSANPGFRDFAVVAEILKDKHVEVSLDVNPTSRRMMRRLAEAGYVAALYRAGARIHQAGCNGCIGMGQAPASGRISLRTVPRNFPGRSGTTEDSVYLCSPETAAASALSAKITDPRDLKMPYPRPEQSSNGSVKPPEKPEHHPNVELVKGPNIKSMPSFEPVGSRFEGPILLKLGDDISTDTILPGGQRVLPYRSNVPKISEFLFYTHDPDYVDRTRQHRDTGSVIVAGKNYGQGSSREHAALAARFVGVRVVIAVSIARIHLQNLINYGVVPLTFENSQDLERVERDNKLVIQNVWEQLRGGTTIQATIAGRETKLSHNLNSYLIDILEAGGRIAHFHQSERVLQSR